MAVEKFTDALIFLHAWNVSGRHNQVQVDYSAEMLDATVFGETTRINAPGLLAWQISGQGFWDSAAVPNQLADPNFFDRMGGAGVPLTLAPKNVDLGVAYFLEAVQGEYSFFGQIGELTPFSLNHNPSRYGTRGQIALPPTSRTVAGNGSTVTLGTLGATQKLVAVMHVIAFVGTDMTMIIQSDDNAPFGTPTTRITFTTVTGVGSEWKELLGPITPDNLFRAIWSGTFTSFTALVAVGVANT